MIIIILFIIKELNVCKTHKPVQCRCRDEADEEPDENMHCFYFQQV